jgi:hypothetical protein
VPDESDERVLSLQINPPEGSEFTYGTQATGISLSPVATDHGKAALWVRPLDGATARVFAGTEDAGLPFWSPDSKSIGFFAQGKLQRVYLPGGSPQTISDFVHAHGGSWSADGQILLGGWNSGLFQVAASGGQPSPLTTLNASRGEIFHYWPQILPGGHFLRPRSPSLTRRCSVGHGDQRVVCTRPEWDSERISTVAARWNARGAGD